MRAEFGGTVNDIALVAVTAALRAMLLARGERPRPDTIRVLTPVATRSANARGRLERLFGSEVHDLAPFAPIAMRLRLGIVRLSYRDTLCFGITGDYDGTPDTDSIARTIPAAVTTLLDRAGR
ncbi:WS/DGAT domain-containing protein [Nocardia farcinica]|uniref:WS/DGAT domain-containing protein n=1 Tax=Nocardia farcinica TaxID=37329 RepID=UPI00311E3694